jgi:hypothetical protein
MPSPDPEKRREIGRRYREKHPEKARAATAAWKLANPDKVEAARLARLEQMTNDPDDRRHGTATGYAIGCRCGVCRTGWSLYREARRAAGKERRR